MIQRRRVLTAVAAGAFTSRGFGATNQASFLTIQGNLRKYTNKDQGTYEFNESEFMALEQQTITTSTTWTPRSTFAGPLLSDVLGHVGGEGKALDILALNDYRAIIPISDLSTYGVVLAHSRDDERMTIDNFGPMWVIYPRDQFPEQLNTSAALARAVWQVCRITLLD